jgi:indolepyruvate ferredoxin oxidoreductase beta subunit
MKYQVVVAGFGGQGAVFLVKVFSNAAGLKDQKFMGAENHGMSQRGGAVSCYIKVGNFYSPAIDEGQADLLIALEANEGLRNIQYLKNDGTIVVNADEKFPPLDHKTIRIDAFDRARKGEFPIQGLNVFMLGIAYAKDPHFPFDQATIEEAIVMMNPKVAPKNIEVFRQAIEDAKEIKI